MFALILDIIVLFLPLFACAFLLYTAIQYNDKHSRRWILPFLLFAFKEIAEFCLRQAYGLGSLRFLYSTESAALPFWVPFAAYAMDLLVLAVFFAYVFSYLEIKKWGRVLYLLVNFLLVSGLVALRIIDYPVNVIFFVRGLTFLNLVFIFFALQKVYFEAGTNFIINSKGYFTGALLFLVPAVFFNFMNVTVLGQLIRLSFYGLLLYSVIDLAYGHYRRIMEQKQLITKEKDLIQRLLNNIGSAIASNQNEQTILDMAVNFAVDATQARAGAILLWNKKKTHLGVVVVQGPYPPLNPVDEFTMSKEKYLVERFKTETVTPGQGYIGKALEAKQPVLIQDATADPSIVQSAKGVIDIMTVMAVPLMVETESLGVLSLLNKSTDTFFSEDDLQLAKAMAEQIAVALNTIALRNEYQDKLESEKQLAIAGQIQQDLLPKTFPVYEHLEIYATSKAAKGVGGDYYDVIDFKERVAFAMADVAGKGVPAALVMVMIRSSMRSMVKTDSEPSQIASAINRALHGEVAEERYATLFYCGYDIHTGMLSYCNGGHAPMLVYRSLTDSFELLDTDGLPVGIAAETVYGQDETVLNAGDIAVLYTDGISEAMNLKHEEYSLARVKEDIRRFKDLGVQDIAARILQNITEFAGDEPQHDDETILVLKVK